MSILTEPGIPPQLLIALANGSAALVNLQEFLDCGKLEVSLLSNGAQQSDLPTGSAAAPTSTSASSKKNTSGDSSSSELYESSYAALVHNAPVAALWYHLSDASEPAVRNVCALVACPDGTVHMWPRVLSTTAPSSSKTAVSYHARLPGALESVRLLRDTTEGQQTLLMRVNVDGARLGHWPAGTGGSGGHASTASTGSASTASSSSSSLSASSMSSVARSWASKAARATSRDTTSSDSRSRQQDSQLDRRATHLPSSTVGSGVAPAPPQHWLLLLERQLGGGRCEWLHQVVGTAQQQKSKSGAVHRFRSRSSSSQKASSATVEVFRPHDASAQLPEGARGAEVHPTRGGDVVAITLDTGRLHVFDVRLGRYPLFEYQLPRALVTRSRSSVLMAENFLLVSGGRSLQVVSSHAASSSQSSSGTEAVMQRLELESNARGLLPECGLASLASDGSPTDRIPGALLWTASGLYHLRGCSHRIARRLFLQSIGSPMGDARAGELLGKTLRLDMLRLYERAADHRFARGEYGRALALYYMSGAETSRLCAQYLRVGRLTTVMSLLRAALHRPAALSDAARAHLSTALVLCRLLHAVTHHHALLHGARVRPAAERSQRHTPTLAADEDDCDNYAEEWLRDGGPASELISLLLNNEDYDRELLLSLLQELSPPLLWHLVSRGLFTAHEVRRAFARAGVLAAPSAVGTGPEIVDLPLLLQQDRAAASSLWVLPLEEQVAMLERIGGAVHSPTSSPVNRLRSVAASPGGVLSRAAQFVPHSPQTGVLPDASLVTYLRDRLLPALLRQPSPRRTPLLRRLSLSLGSQLLHFSPGRLPGALVESVLTALSFAITGETSPNALRQLQASHRNLLARLWSRYRPPLLFEVSRYTHDWQMAAYLYERLHLPQSRFRCALRGVLRAAGESSRTLADPEKSASEANGLSVVESVATPSSQQLIGEQVLSIFWQCVHGSRETLQAAPSLWIQVALFQQLLYVWRKHKLPTELLAQSLLSHTVEVVPILLELVLHSGGEDKPTSRETLESPPTAATHEATVGRFTTLLSIIPTNCILELIAACLQKLRQESDASIEVPLERLWEQIRANSAKHLTESSYHPYISIPIISLAQQSDERRRGGDPNAADTVVFTTEDAYPIHKPPTTTLQQIRQALASDAPLTAEVVLTEYSQRRISLASPRVLLEHLRKK